MMFLVGVCVGNQCRLQGLAEFCLDVIKTEDSVDCGDIQRAVLEGHTDRHIEPAGNDFYLACCARIGNGVDVAFRRRSCEYGSIFPERQPACIRHLGPNID